MYEIFEQLLKQHGVTAYRVAKDTGVTTATLTSWKQGKYTPKPEKMQKIADYFGVDSQYLLFGDEKSPLVPADERALDDELVSKLTSLTPEEMQKVDAFVQGLLANR